MNGTTARTQQDARYLAAARKHGAMIERLARGQNVKISGFGSFILRDKRERVGRNPKTGVEVPITPRRVMTFRASQKLKDRIGKGA